MSLIRCTALGTVSFVEFPLRIVSTQSVNSVDSRAIQFCDILAGLGTRHFDPRSLGSDREFMDELVEGGLNHISYNGIRPAPVFPDRIPPKRLSGPDIVDQMTRIIFGPHHSDVERFDRR